MMVTDLILSGIGLLGLTAASIHDWKTREVPDWITLGLIAAGFGLRLLGSMATKEWSYLLYGLVGFLIAAALSNLMYYTKQWGGGDAKMLMALGTLFATRPSFIEPSPIPFLLILFVHILLFGAIYGLIWGISLAWKQKTKFLAAAKKLMQEKRMIRIRMSALIIAIVIFSIAVMVPDPMAKLAIMILSLMTLLYPYLWIYIKAVEQSCLFKYLAPRQLTEGDWVEQDIMVNKKIIYKRKNTGIEKEDIRKLIQARVKKVLVKEGIPFIPPFLLGTIATLLQLNMLNWF